MADLRKRIRATEEKNLRKKSDFFLRIQEKKKKNKKDVPTFPLPSGPNPLSYRSDKRSMF